MTSMHLHSPCYKFSPCYICMVSVIFKTACYFDTPLLADSQDDEEDNELLGKTKTSTIYLSWLAEVKASVSP